MCSKKEYGNSYSIKLKDRNVCPHETRYTGKQTITTDKQLIQGMSHDFHKYGTKC